MKILWKPNPIASWVHLAWTQSRDCKRMAPESLPGELSVSTDDSHNSKLWSAARRQAAAMDAPHETIRVSDWHELARRVHEDAEFNDAELMKADDTAAQPTSDATAAWLIEQYNDLRESHPRLTDDLAARIRPLREQWEARSPGFVRHLCHSFGESPTPNATLQLSLVPPLLGGFAEAQLSPSIAAGTMEAMLYHPNPSVPEPVRLGWLVAQALARPSSLRLDPAQLAWLTLPAVHEAATVVDWCQTSFTDEWVAHWRIANANAQRIEDVRRWWASSEGKTLSERIAMLVSSPDDSPNGSDDRRP